VNCAVVVLAAGYGTRMKSDTPKVLHRMLGKPIITHVLNAVAPLAPERVVVVLNPQGADIRKELADRNVTFAVQHRMMGTGDAVKAAVPSLRGFSGTILIVNGDTPVLSAASLKNFLAAHKRYKEGLSLLSFLASPPHEYGRILREDGRMIGIIENRDCDEKQRLINEVNSGVYAVEATLLPLLRQIKMNASKGEFYLTDIVGIAVRKGLKVGAHIIGAPEEYTGINTRADLLAATTILRSSIAEHWMREGVTLLDRGATFIGTDVKIGADTILYPNVHLEGKTVIGKRCVIFPNCRLVDCVLADDVTIKDGTVMEDCAVGAHAAVGPMAHIRPGTHIETKAKIGNFVEIKKSHIGAGAKASHLSYIGDAEIGSDVNIGAGTITCNYDGAHKHKTVVEDGVFIGSDTQLVAPVRIGAGAFIGAGSTITKDVPPLALGLSRQHQTVIEGWATRRQKKEHLGNTTRKGERRR